MMDPLLFLILTILEEEVGLLGSTYYMQNLNDSNQEGLANIVVNLNFDMVGMYHDMALHGL